MRKVFFLILLSLNMQTFAGLWISGDGRIRTDPTLVENFIAGLPQYTVDEGTPITLPVPTGYTGFCSRISFDGSVISGQLFKIDDDGIWMDWRGAVWEQIKVIDDKPIYSDPLLLPSLAEEQSNWKSDMSINGKYLAGYSIIENWSPGLTQAVYWDETR